MVSSESTFTGSGEESLHSLMIVSQKHSPQFFRKRQCWVAGDACILRGTKEDSEGYILFYEHVKKRGECLSPDINWNKRETRWQILTLSRLKRLVIQGCCLACCEATVGLVQSFGRNWVGLLNVESSSQFSSLFFLPLPSVFPLTVSVRMNTKKQKLPL